MSETRTTLRERALEAHRRNQAEIASDAARREAKGREEAGTRLREQALRILGDFVPVDGEIVWGANDCGFPRPTVTVDGVTFSVDAHGETGTAESLAEVRELAVFVEARVEAAAFEAARRAMRDVMEAGA